MQAAMRQIFARAQSAFCIADAQGSAVSLFLVVLLFLSVVMLPSGILDSNEEYYFALAAHVLHPDGIQGGSIIGEAGHTLAYSLLAGWLIELFGFAGAHVIGRVALAVLYAVAVTRLFRLFSFSLLDAALVFAGFLLLGQQILGGEFLFLGVEPKTLAYPFVIFALRDAFDAQLVRCAAMLAIATTFHFLVGGFWFVFVFLFLVLERRGPILSAALMYGLLSLPVVVLILSNHYDQFAVRAASDGPTASWIYSVFAMPHHVSPFISLWQFASWAPRIALLLGITLTCAAMATFGTGIQVRLARLNLIALVFLILALLASALDRGGHLGPFVLFRPSSLALFLWLIQVARYLRLSIERRASVALRAGALTILLSWVIPNESLMALDTVRQAAKLSESRETLYAFVRREVGPHEATVIGPALEPELLGFERNTGRPALVITLFVPSSRDDLLEWYRRIEYRADLLTAGCNADTAYDVQFLILPSPGTERTPLVFEHCARVVFRNPRYTVLRLNDARSG